MKTTTIIVYASPDEEGKSSPQNHHLLRPPDEVLPPVYKPFPRNIIQSIEDDRRRRVLPHSRSTSDFLHVHQSSIETTDDDLADNEDTTTTSSGISKAPKRSSIATRTKRSPSEVRVSLYPDSSRDLHDPANDRSGVTYKDALRASDPSLLDTKFEKQIQPVYARRALLDHRFGRRIHSSFSSSTTLRSSSRRRSMQNLPFRTGRRHTHYLVRTSKWHFVRNHLHEIAMMNERYARMKIIERDLRWVHLREQICKQVLDMREMLILRQEDDGLVKKTQKTNFDLKSIPANDVVHVERDGRVYSIGTRDLVLGRMIGGETVQLDTFVQLDARRKFQVKQNLSRRQEGRTRLKKNIAFSFCLCNLSFIVVMFAMMFIFAMKTFIELRSREFF